jgi:hypothetical protein
MGGHVSRTYIQGFGGTRGEKRPLGRPRRRLEDNIKVDLQEMGWGARTGLIWLRIRTGGAHVNKVMNIWVQ